MVDLNNEICQLVTGSKKIAKEWIEEIVYSPNHEILAVGSHDNRIYLYNTHQDQPYTQKAVCTGHSSYITTVDFCTESQWLRTTCGAYELLFWNIADGTLKNNGGGATGTVGTLWDDHHAKFGWRVDGIYPPGTDGTHINTVTMTKDEEIIATGDDYGMVNLYRNPCRDPESH